LGGINLLDHVKLVFEEPWESRAFGMAAALADSGAFSWKDFQAGLIAAIAERDASSDDNSQVYRYYVHWLGALETLVVDRGLISLEDIKSREIEFLERPAGHDHGSEHDH